MTQKEIKILKYLWQRIRVGEKNECWEWQGPLTELGYGRIRSGNRESRPHRELYKLLHPEIDISDLHVRHLCHNRSCCNPSHLKHGTAKDNKRDSMNDGREISGLTTKKVKEIVKLVERGRSQSSIAREFHISPKTVSRIWCGDSWAHVTGRRESARAG